MPIKYRPVEHKCHKMHHKGEWLNTTQKIWGANGEIKKPCHMLRYCPYGQLVEEYPLHQKDKYSCLTFGHDCPVYYMAEIITE